MLAVSLQGTQTVLYTANIHYTGDSFMLGLVHMQIFSMPLFSSIMPWYLFNMYKALKHLLGSNLYQLHGYGATIASITLIWTLQKAVQLAEWPKLHISPLPPPSTAVPRQVMVPEPLPANASLLDTCRCLAAVSARLTTAPVYTDTFTLWNNYWKQSILICPEA